MKIIALFTGVIVSSIQASAGTAILEPELVSPQIQCFFTSWSRYRDSWGYTPANVNPFLCTTIVYAFGQILDDQMAVYDWKDEDNLFDLVQLKQINPKLRIHLSVGGWTLSYQFKPMVATAESRTSFINSTVDFLRSRNLDGLDVDWEYPEVEDIQTYSALLRELRSAFDEDARKTGKRRLSLSIDVGAHMHGGYDVPLMNTLVDLVNVMAYDLHGHWEQKTGHNAPLFRRKSEQDFQTKLNVEYCTTLWTNAGVNKKKLSIGIPTYGRSWLLKDTNVNGFQAPTRGAGWKGVFSKEAGSLAYFEICDRILSKNLTVVHNDECQCSYAYSADFWVSYDDPDSVTKKAAWVLRNGYNGVLVWELGMDDWKGACGGKQSPMFTSIYEVFNGKPVPTLPPTKPPKPGATTTTPLPRPTPKPIISGKVHVCDDLFCTSRPIGDYSLGSCQSAYCSCVGTTSYKRECPPGVMYDPSNKVCSWPDAIPGCAAVDVNKPKEEELKNCKKQGNCTCSSQFCAKRGLGDFALGPCQGSFCGCAPGNLAYEKQCPATLIFDPRLSVCNWKSSVTTCS